MMLTGSKLWGYVEHMRHWAFTLGLLVCLPVNNALAQGGLPSEPAAPASRQTAQFSASSPVQGYITLHIDTDTQNVQLRSVVFEDTAIAAPYLRYTLVSGVLCRMPCDRVIDGRLGNEYYFGGSGVTDSGRFTLLDYQGAVKARVNAGSQGLRTASKVLFWVGVGLAGPGSAIYLATANASTGPSDAGIRGLHTVSGGMLLGGAASMVAGIVMYFSSRTTFELEQVR